MADTQTERPNRPPEDNPFLDCPEDVVNVYGAEDMPLILFDDGTLMRIYEDELIYSNPDHGV